MEQTLIANERGTGDGEIRNERKEKTKERKTYLAMISRTVPIGPKTKMTAAEEAEEAEEVEK